MSTGLHNSFIKLVRLGIGQTPDAHLKFRDWQELQILAMHQGLLSIVIDGIEKLPEKQHPQKEIILDWIGLVMQDESRCLVQTEAASKMALLFRDNDIRTYVLKGDVVSECYPKPEHRVSSDMDCFLLSNHGTFDAWSFGNDLIRTRGFQVSTDFYKNSTFYLPGLTVESHQFMVPFRGNKRLKKLEIMLENILHEDKGEDRFKGTYLYRPPVMASALFLIEHAYSHFLHEGLTWRHVLDWMMFSRKHNDDINWLEFDALVEEFGFRKFYDSFCQLGTYLLGEQSFESLEVKERRMLDDIWAPLDLHESLHGVRAKFQLAGNYWRARWKYKYFTDMTWLRAMMEWVFGAVFDRHPKLD